jgi:hypothetical protein
MAFLIALSLIGFDELRPLLRDDDGRRGVDWLMRCNVVNGAL